MKPIYVVLALLASVTILTMTTKQIYAPRDCGQCTEFKKLTSQFEKDVIDAALQQPPDPDRIQTLLDQYNDDVMALFSSPSPSP